MIITRLETMPVVIRRPWWRPPLLGVNPWGLRNLVELPAAGEAHAKKHSNDPVSYVWVCGTRKPNDGGEGWFQFISANSTEEL